MSARDDLFVRLAGAGGERLLDLPPALREAVLGQFEHHAGRRVARDLGRLLEAPWWRALELDDGVRAARIVAHVSARAGGAPVEALEPSARTILEGTLASLLPPQGCFALGFDGLPLDLIEGGRVVAGYRQPPDRVVLNRGAIRVCDAPLGDGDPLELRVGLATLVHEVNHLHNLTPAGPTYEAYQDEYRAWLVDFVAHVGRRPRGAEAGARCRELLCRAEDGLERGSGYEALRRAVEERSEHGVRMLEHLAMLEAGDPMADAPLPDPPLHLSNAPRRKPA